jgi:starvation-inducible DNA-binding protein
MSKKVVEGLKKLLADNYTLYLKTQNFHWNVTGPNFQSLHQLFMTQYTDLFNANDAIAERIRALGSKAPGSFKEFSKLTTIKEAEGNLTAKQMVQELIKGQDEILKTLRKVADEADDADDEVTEGMLVARMEIHEKNRWMLQASV